MIVAKSPLRITLGGGGTDLASYYEKKGGFLISASVDKYVYVLINKTFDNMYLLKYSKLEHVKKVSELKHPIVREALRMLDLEKSGMEICSMADIPAGTGLGSSSAFTTSLLCALHGFRGDIVDTRTLAEEACEIEIGRLGEPIGKQDQYASSYGGIICMTIQKDGYVEVMPLEMPQETFYNLEDNLAFFFTGYSHSAGDILGEQDRQSKCGNGDMIKNLDFVKQLGLDSKRALENGDLGQFAEIMNIHWEYKKKRSNGMTNPEINEWYDYALKNGASGGKLIGAGGGGFLMFYAENKVKLRDAMGKAGLEEVRIRLGKGGAKLL